MKIGKGGEVEILVWGGAVRLSPHNLSEIRGDQSAGIGERNRAAAGEMGEVVIDLGRGVYRISIHNVCSIYSANRLLSVIHIKGQLGRNANLSQSHIIRAQKLAKFA